MLSSGQLLKHEEREPISHAEEGIYEVNYTNKRTNIVRLLLNDFQKRKLRKLSNISSKLFNELNYESRQQFFHEKKVDFNKTWNKYYNNYKKEELGINAQAVMQKCFYNC